MAKLVIKGVIGVLFLGVLGVFIFRIYQQRGVLLEIHHWVVSAQYIFEGIDDERMHRQLMLQRLNNYIPALDKIFNASLIAGDTGLEKNDIDLCRRYYQLVLEDMPQMKEAHVFLGLCEGKAGNIPGAFLEFKQGLDSDAGVFWASYDLGILAMMNGNKDAAQVLFFQVAKLPLGVVMKNIFVSRLFQQYMQINNITPQKLLEGLNEAREDAIQKLRFIQENHEKNLLP